MIFFLFGQDTYRSREKLKEIVDHYKTIHKSRLNLRVLDLKEKSFEDFKNEISFSPMFSEKKLVVLKNAFSNKDFKEKFLKEIKNFTKPREIILFYEEAWVKEDGFLKAIKKYGKCQEFKPLGDWQLKIWFKKEIKDLGAKIEERALQKLIEFVGNDLWRMSNEIRKLVNYSNGKMITEKEIELLVRPKIEIDIFRTIEAIAEKNKKKALKLLKNHLEKGEKAGYLLAMIKYQFKNLLMIKDLIERKTPISTILKKIQLKRSVFQRDLALTKKFNISELKSIYQKIFEIDLAIKTSKIEPETALHLLIAEI